MTLDELAGLAEKATPGPWHREIDNIDQEVAAATYWVIGANRAARKDGAVALGYNSNNDDNDTAYIAACDPGTVLKLLAVVREAQEVKEHEYGHLAQQSRARANLFTALAALESTP